MSAVPASTPLLCPRCHFRWYFVNDSEGGISVRCGGCEWLYTIGTPTVSSPGVASSTTPVTNSTGTVVAAAISGGTLTSVVVNGTQVGTTAGTYLVPPGGTISITYSVAPTWTWALPVTNGAMALNAVAMPVASGGTLIAAQSLLFIDSGQSAEVLTVGSGSTGTSVVVGSSAKAHNSGVAFGNVVATPANLTAQRVPAAPGYGF